MKFYSYLFNLASSVGFVQEWYAHRMRIFHNVCRLVTQRNSEGQRVRNSDGTIAIKAIQMNYVDLLSDLKSGYNKESKD